MMTNHDNMYIVNVTTLNIQLLTIKNTYTQYSYIYVYVILVKCRRMYIYE